ncbi:MULTISPECIES: alpha/beta fold hydrolase [Cyanophyceae]|uniref:alpha/beta fold hydrolase n=1 Tax=Cyanophyceae TaxID=3028117 RepID=UPI001688CD83|nr:alpha/beta hydrolase [Trichocoleus sp. FACHB-69]MBD1932082.1 alpha/beta hydrolase [Trichocoleus sp. FACHB-69]
MEQQFIEKQVNLGECCITYFEKGVASGLSPILFIHGWGVLVEPYQASLNILSERYHVIAPILPGLGQSTAPEIIQDYTDYGRVLIDFLMALNLKKVHVLGHSEGGAIGMALAALMPSMVRSLTIADSTGIPLGSVLEVVAKRAVEMPAQMWQMKVEPVTEVFKNLLYNSLTNTQNLINMGFIGIEKDIRPLLASIESPCLILWGKNDLLTPVSFAHEFYQNIKDSQLIVVDEVYHEWVLFFPEKFASMILDFIDKIENIN